MPLTTEMSNIFVALNGGELPSGSFTRGAGGYLKETVDGESRYYAKDDAQLYSLLNTETIAPSESTNIIYVPDANDASLIKYYSKDAAGVIQRIDGRNKVVFRIYRDITGVAPLSDFIDVTKYASELSFTIESISGTSAPFTPTVYAKKAYSNVLKNTTDNIYTVLNDVGLIEAANRSISITDNKPTSTTGDSNIFGVNAGQVIEAVIGGTTKYYMKGAEAWENREPSTGGAPINKGSNYFVEVKDAAGTPMDGEANEWVQYASEHGISVYDFAAATPANQPLDDNTLSSYYYEDGDTLRTGAYSVDYDAGTVSKVPGSERIFIRKAAGLIQEQGTNHFYAYSDAGFREAVKAAGKTTDGDIIHDMRNLDNLTRALPLDTEGKIYTVIKPGLIQRTGGDGMLEAQNNYYNYDSGLTWEQFAAEAGAKDSNSNSTLFKKTDNTTVYFPVGANMYFMKTGDADFNASTYFTNITGQGPMRKDEGQINTQFVKADDNVLQYMRDGNKYTEVLTPYEYQGRTWTEYSYTFGLNVQNTGNGTFDAKYEVYAFTNGTTPKYKALRDTIIDLLEGETIEDNIDNHTWSYANDNIVNDGTTYLVFDSAVTEEQFATNANSGCYPIGAVLHDRVLATATSPADDTLITKLGVDWSKREAQISTSIDTWIQQGSDIDGLSSAENSGWSVSLSADGTIVAIGSPNYDINNGSRGRVMVYKKINNSWEQYGNTILGFGSAQLGWSVKLSADGNTIAVGGPGADFTIDGMALNDAGIVRLYRFNNSNTTWEQFGDDGSVFEPYAGTGNSVSLSANGNIIAVGAQGWNNYRGKVAVFEYNNGNFIQLGADLTEGPETQIFGSSVSLSADGTILAVGAGGGGGHYGFTRVYKYNNGSWAALGAHIGLAAADNLGVSVSLSADGSIVAVGANYSHINGHQSGKVEVYKYNTTVSPPRWEIQGSAIVGESAGDRSGNSVSLSADGTVVAIGARFNDNPNGTNSGHVRVYKFTNSSWAKVATDIDGELGGDESGFSVSLSADGNTVAIGAIYNNGSIGTNSYAGHVRVYTLEQETSSSTSTTTQVQAWSLRGMAGAALGSSTPSVLTIVKNTITYDLISPGYIKLNGSAGTFYTFNLNGTETGKTVRAFALDSTTQNGWTLSVYDVSGSDSYSNTCVANLDVPNPQPKRAEKVVSNGATIYGLISYNTDYMTFNLDGVVEAARNDQGSAVADGKTIYKMVATDNYFYEDTQAEVWIKTADGLIENEPTTTYEAYEENGVVSAVTNGTATWTLKELVYSPLDGRKTYTIQAKGLLRDVNDTTIYYGYTDIALVSTMSRYKFAHEYTIGDTLIEREGGPVGGDAAFPSAHRAVETLHLTYQDVLLKDSNGQYYAYTPEGLDTVAKNLFTASGEKIVQEIRDDAGTPGFNGNSGTSPWANLPAAGNNGTYSTVADNILKATYSGAIPAQYFSYDFGTLNEYIFATDSAYNQYESLTLRYHGEDAYDSYDGQIWTKITTGVLNSAANAAAELDKYNSDPLVYTYDKDLGVNNAIMGLKNASLYTEAGLLENGWYIMSNMTNALYYREGRGILKRIQPTPETDATLDVFEDSPPAQRQAGQVVDATPLLRNAARRGFPTGSEIYYNLWEDNNYQGIVSYTVDNNTFFKSTLSVVNARLGEDNDTVKLMFSATTADVNTTLRSFAEAINASFEYGTATGGADGQTALFAGKKIVDHVDTIEPTYITYTNVRLGLLQKSDGTHHVYSDNGLISAAVKLSDASVSITAHIDGADSSYTWVRKGLLRSSSELSSEAIMFYSDYSAASGDEKANMNQYLYKLATLENGIGAVEFDLGTNNITTISEAAANSGITTLYAVEFNDATATVVKSIKYTRQVQGGLKGLLLTDNNTPFYLAFSDNSQYSVNDAMYSLGRLANDSNVPNSNSTSIYAVPSDNAELRDNTNEYRKQAIGYLYSTMPDNPAYAFSERGLKNYTLAHSNDTVTYMFNALATLEPGAYEYAAQNTLKRAGTPNRYFEFDKVTTLEDIVNDYENCDWSDGTLDTVVEFVNDADLSATHVRTYAKYAYKLATGTNSNGLVRVDDFGFVYPATHTDDSTRNANLYGLAIATKNRIPAHEITGGGDISTESNPRNLLTLATDAKKWMTLAASEMMAKNLGTTAINIFVDTTTDYNSAIQVLKRYVAYNNTSIDEIVKPYTYTVTPTCITEGQSEPGTVPSPVSYEVVRSSRETGYAVNYQNGADNYPVSILKVNDFASSYAAETDVAKQALLRTVDPTEYQTYGYAGLSLLANNVFTADGISNKSGDMYADSIVNYADGTDVYVWKQLSSDGVPGGLIASTPELSPDEGIWRKMMDGVVYDSGNQTLNGKMIIFDLSSHSTNDNKLNDVLSRLDQFQFNSIDCTNPYSKEWYNPTSGGLYTASMKIQYNNTSYGPALVSDLYFREEHTLHTNGAFRDVVERTLGLTQDGGNDAILPRTRILPSPRMLNDAVYTMGPWNQRGEHNLDVIQRNGSTLYFKVFFGAEFVSMPHVE